MPRAVIDRRLFAAGMAELALAFPGRALTDGVLDAYADAMGDLTPAQWEQARLACLRGFVPSKLEPFPHPATLRRYALPFRDGNAEAVEAFEWLCAGGGSRYDPTRGTHWLWSEVVRERGVVVGEAFMAAGGSKAFEREQEGANLQWLRKRFVEAYQLALAAEREGRLVAPPPPHRFPRILREVAKGIGDGPQRKALPPGEPHGD